MLLSVTVLQLVGSALGVLYNQLSALPSATFDFIIVGGCLYLPFS